MPQITLRGIDPKVETIIRSMAKEKGKSLNRVIIDMIYQHTEFHKRKKNPATKSLKKMAGGWSKKDASTFLNSIKSCEQIDEDMWK